MPRAKTIQTNFSSGVLDPLLAGRTDLEIYYQGLKRGENILPRLQGGFSRRPGSKYCAAVDTDGRIEPFAFNTEQTYVVYFGDSEIKVFLEGALQATVSSPWAATEVAELGIAQTADTMIICHEDYEPRQLVRGTSHTSWTLSTYSLKNIPLADYNDTSSPTPTAEIYTLTFSTSPAWQQGDYFYLKLEDKWETERIYWATDTSVLATRIQTAIAGVLVGTRTVYPDEMNSGQADNFGPVSETVQAARIQGLSEDGVTVNASAYPAVTVTLDEGNADSYTELTVTRVDSTASGTIASVLTQAGTRRREPVFSATRGWPKYPIFFEARLWFGGCKSKPQAVFATRTNLYDDMGLGDSLDDEGIFMLLDTDEVNAVTGLIAGRNMVILTTGGEHVIAESPATPGTAFAPKQTDYGSLPIRPQQLEGSAVFAQKRGKQIMETTFYWQEDAYQTKSVSLLSQHLIATPIQMATQKGTSLDTANYLFVVNDDGTMAVLLSSRAQEVAAWTQWKTDGKYRSVCVIEDDVYALVERTIDGSTVYYLEQFATNVYTDAASIQTFASPTDTVTGLSHLEGENVKVRADGGLLYPDETVASGQIAMEQTATEVEIGLNYIPIAETMPPSMNFGDGAGIASKKRITWIKVMVDSTRGMVIDGDTIPDRQTDVDPLNTPPPERTGVVEHRSTGSDWAILPTVTFSQVDPHPMTVLAAVYEVEVNEL